MAGMGKREPRRRGAGFWVGLTMVAAGLAMLGYVGWQLFGTNYVSKQAHERIARELQQQWAQGEGLSPEPTAKPGRLHLGQADALIRIPAFGKNYAVPVLEGVSDGVLAQGYGHFAKTAAPGKVGNYALAAHRVTHGEPLRGMPNLRPGDEVIVETRDATYTYRLDTNPNDLVVPFTGIWVIDPVPTNPNPGGVQPRQRAGQRLITLTTCSELFHTDNRMIAFGHLVKTVPRGTVAAG